MKITAKIAVPIVIAVVIVAAAGYYILSSATPTYGVSVKMTLLNPQPALYPYAIAYYLINVSNTGSAAFTNMTVGVFVNGVQYHAYVVSLQPHTNVSVNGTYLYQGAGNFSFAAVADPGRVLNIQNRAAAESGFNATVENPVSPAIYSYVPNNGLNTTLSFSNVATGLDFVLYLDQGFGVKPFGRMLGLGDNTTVKTFEAITSLVKGVDGAYSTYANNSKVYTAWVQGTLNTQYMAEIFNALKIKYSNVTVNGNTVTLTGINGTTSLCTSYYGGWTVLLEYYNASTQGNCSGIILRQYNDTISNTLVDFLTNNPHFQSYQSNFDYANSTYLGSATLYSASNAITSINMMQNGYGFFAMELTQFPVPQDFNSINSVCSGPLSRTATSSVCSGDVSTVANVVNSSVALVDSTGIYSNYTLTVYSLVSKNQSYNAHTSAAGLISYLSIPENFLIWNGNLPTTCKFLSSNGVTCQGLGVSAANSSEEVLSIRNNLGTPVTVNKISCFIPGFGKNTTVNQQLNNNAALNLTVPCLGSVPGYFSDYFDYNLTLNYTQNGSNRLLNGTLGIPNTGS